MCSTARLFTYIGGAGDNICADGGPPAHVGQVGVAGSNDLPLVEEPGAVRVEVLARVLELWQAEIGLDPDDSIVEPNAH